MLSKCLLILNFGHKKNVEKRIYLIIIHIKKGSYPQVNNNLWITLCKFIMVTL